MELICKVCGHKWIPRIEKPQECPKCKSYKYEIGVEKRKEKL